MNYNRGKNFTKKKVKSSINDNRIKMIEGELKKMKSIENQRRYLHSKNMVIVRTKCGCYGKTCKIDLKGTELKPKMIQRIIDDYCVKFNWNYEGIIKYDKKELGNNQKLTIEEIINKIYKINFSMDKWLYDFDYYMNLYQNNKLVTNTIIEGIEPRMDEFSDELKEFCKNGKKGELMEDLDIMWDNWSRKYLGENGEFKTMNDEEYKGFYNSRIEDITKGYRTPVNFNPHKEVEKLLSVKQLVNKVEEYIETNKN